MRDQADSGREEGRIVGRAMDRLAELAVERATDGRDVDADFLEHLAFHHAAHAATTIGA